MSGVSLPIHLAVNLPVTATRPKGRALVVAGESCRRQPIEAMQRLGFACADVEDPYAAMSELCRQPLAYRALILSLASLFREELALIGAVKQRWPHIEIWLTHIDGRQAALADAMLQGADGLLSDEGLHRMTAPAVAVKPAQPAKELHDSSPKEPANGSFNRPANEVISTDAPKGAPPSDEPLLSADELRALLHDPHEPAVTPPAQDRQGH